MSKKISIQSKFIFVFAFISGIFIGSTMIRKSSAEAVVVDANIFVNLSKKIVPSVVNISTLSTVKSPFRSGSPDEMFRRFFEDFFRQHGGGPGGGMPDPGEEGEDSGSKIPKAMSLGSGFIIDEGGLILTNNHVVAEADEIKIQFTEEADEKPTDGEVVGRDPELDLALIRVKTSRKLIPLVLGDSDALEVGEYVIAVGNPFGQGHSVTHGIISAKNRKTPEFQLGNYLQTDAPINPGNSGGPLVNLKGEVIGINNAIDQRAQGIGFAIPSDLVKKVLPQLKSKGVVARGYIGVLVNELNPEISSKLSINKELKAPFVTHVYPGEPADRAGIKPYDVILELGGKKIRSSRDLIAAVTNVPVGETVAVKILRSGQEKALSLKVAQRPGAQTLAKKSEAKKKGTKSRASEIGVQLQELNPELAKELNLSEKVTGILVDEVAYGSPADRAGLMRGDVILEVDKKAVGSQALFEKSIAAKKSYLLRVRRLDSQGREVFVVIILDLKGE